MTRVAVALAVVLGLPALAAAPAAAQGFSLPGISFTGSGGPREVSTALEIVAGLTVLTLAPSIVIMLTCCAPIVPSLLRRARVYDALTRSSRLARSSPS
jgi:flagellar biosynthetic protein FliP